MISCKVGRILLCAPTNVGAANLYNRCLQDGYSCDTSLVIPPDRVPVGTPIMSNDPHKRIVCSTISGRNGPTLIDQEFEHVLVDEAAQCMEAWLWTLLRPRVQTLVLAGDVMQLPACTSLTGKTLRHDRSLMERLIVDLKYGNTVHLTEQNRMAPQLLLFPNMYFLR